MVFMVLNQQCFGEVSHYMQKWHQNLYWLDRLVAMLGNLLIDPKVVLCCSLSRKENNF